MSVQTLGNSLEAAFASAPLLEYHEGEWQLPGDVLEGMAVEGAADLSDLDLLNLNSDGELYERPHEVTVPSFTSLYAATLTMIGMSGIDPAQEASKVSADAVHERDHEMVLGLSGIEEARFCVQFFRSPRGSAAANRADVIAKQTYVAGSWASNPSVV